MGFLINSLSFKRTQISFLNAVLEKQQGEEIIDVSFNDPHTIPETSLAKQCIFDIRCTDEKERQYIIEIQVITQRHFTYRAQYYSSLALSRQLVSGEKYEKLVPVIFVGILDFNLFDTDNYISHHRILDEKTHTNFFNLLEFHCIELPKFTHEVTQQSILLEKWIYLIK